MKDRKAKSLSAGERRRLSIAEEIIHGPSICIVDEPVKDLPTNETVLIMNALETMASQNRTVIVSLTKVKQLYMLIIFLNYKTVMVLFYSQLMRFLPCATPWFYSVRAVLYIAVQLVKRYHFL